MAEELNYCEFYTDNDSSINSAKYFINAWFDQIVKEHKKEGSSGIKVYLGHEAFKVSYEENFLESPIMRESKRGQTQGFAPLDQNIFNTNPYTNEISHFFKPDLGSQWNPNLSDQSQMLDESLTLLQSPENAGAGFLDQEHHYPRENVLKNEYGEPGEPGSMFQPQLKEDSPASRKDLHINLKKPFLIVHHHPKEEKKDEFSLEQGAQSSGKRINSKIYNGSLPEFIDLSKVDEKNIEDLGGDPKQLKIPLKIEKWEDNCYKIGFGGKIFCYLTREDTLFYSDKARENCKKDPESFLMATFNDNHCQLEKVCTKIINSEASKDSKGAVDELCSLLKNLKKEHESDSEIYFKIFDHFSKKNHEKNTEKNMINSYPELHKCLSNHSNNQYFAYSVSIFLAWKKSGLPLKFELSNQDIQECFNRAAWEITLAKVTYNYHCERSRKRKNIPPLDSPQSKDFLASSKKTRVTDKKNPSSAQQKAS